MIKLRGINVWPEAIGEYIKENQKVNGEYFCYVERVGSPARDEMTVMVEAKYLSSDYGLIKEELEELLKKKVGVKINVSIVNEDELQSLTGHGIRAKLKRFEDRR